MSLDAPSWMVALLESVSVWDAVLALGVVVAAVVFVKKRAWRGIVAFARGIVRSAEMMTALNGLQEFMARTDATLLDHTKQLANSHSTNLRDDVTAAVDASEKTRVLVEEEVLPRLEALARADDDLWSALDDTQNPNDGGNDD